MTDAVINSWNEWGPLKRVIVGRIDSRHVGAPDPGFVNVYPELGIPFGDWVPIPNDYMERADAQMESFVSIREGRGINVYRPTTLDF